MRVDSSMKNETLMGLMLTMLVLKDFDSSHIGTFISDLPQERKADTLGLFQGELLKLFTDKGVCRWLASYPQYSNSESLRLADYLCANHNEMSFSVM